MFVLLAYLRKKLRLRVARNGYGYVDVLRMGQVLRVGYSELGKEWVG